MKTKDMMIEYVSRVLDHYGLREIAKDDFDNALVYSFNNFEVSSIVHTTEEAMERFAMLDDMSIIQAEDIVNKYTTVPDCRARLFNLMADYYIYENNIIEEVLRKRVAE